MGSDRHVLTIGSIFRNSTAYVDRYFAQVDALEEALGGSVRLILAEGDSDDDTFGALEVAARPGDLLLHRAHGGPVFGSVDHPQRWAQIAYVCNAVMERYAADDDGRDLVYVESDLLWEPDVMLQLAEDLRTVPAVAPLSLRDNRFYDLWGHRGLDGERFTIAAPYHPDLETEDALVEISSAGSCVAMCPAVAQVARWGELDGMVGLGRSIRFAAGGHLYLDRRVAVRHP